MSNGIKVKKRNGSIEPLDLDKMHLMVDESCKGLSGVSASQVEMSSGLQFYDGISTADIQEILIKSAADLISLDSPNYQYVAARLLLFSIRKSIYGGRIDLPHLEDHINRCVSLNVYDSDIYNKYSKEEIDKANSFIDHDRDFLFTYAGLRQVVDKYLVQDRSSNNLYETPQFMYIMIALTLFAEYPKEKRMHYVKKYYDAISKHKINIPTPIMAGVRTPSKQFASCCLIDVDDTLDSIIASDGAMMKYIAGRAGIGLNIGRLRGINSKIRNGETVSTGVVPFIKKFEASLSSCHQGGLRKGSMTLYFPIWHQEIESVIVLKNNKGNEENRARKIDYNIQLSKIFYERFIQNGEITLFSPHNVPGLYEKFGMPGFDELYVQYENDSSIPKKKVKAQDLILELLKERAETGRIYLMNIDHCNSHSPFKDQITMSNLCVSGNTKIKIKYPESVGDQYGTWYWNVLEKEIKIEDLEEYVIMRQCEMYDSNAPQIEVLSYDIETSEKKWAPITDFAETSPKSKVMKITDEETGKSIVVTPDHKVFTKNRGYVMAKDLVETDELIIL
jgi:ribonucleoside-diphosphate reductase alpha chain